MKAVLLDVPECLLEQRRLSGADRLDEVWEGVLHMVPPPSIEHQDIEGRIETWLRTYWSPLHPSHRVFHQVALSASNSWTNDYRVPDIVLLDEQTIANLRDTHCQGPCTVALEVRSPNDELFEKMEFYARLQVSELWFVDRDSKKLEVYALADGGYRLFEADSDGWISSRSVAIQMRSYDGGLCFQIIEQPDSRRLL